MDDALTKAIAEMSDAECRKQLDDAARENGRLRAILDGIARAGVGKGALVEVSEGADGRSLRIAVCRADVGEEVFAESMRDALHEVARAMGGKGDLSPDGVTGVLALSPKGGE